MNLIKLAVLFEVYYILGHVAFLTNLFRMLLELISHCSLSMFILYGIVCLVCLHIDLFFFIEFGTINSLNLRTKYNVSLGYISLAVPCTLWYPSYLPFLLVLPLF
jgi:hypothetical protein